MRVDVRLALTLGFALFASGCETRPWFGRDGVPSGDGGLFFDGGGFDIAAPIDIAVVPGACRLSFTPPQIDFGHIAIGANKTLDVLFANAGDGTCLILSPTLSGDPEFSIPQFTTTIDIPPGVTTTLPITFNAVDRSVPHHKTSTLVFTTNDPATPKASIPLSADVDIGCDLTASPAALAFGNVILNTTANQTVVLGNDGSSACDVSVALAVGTDVLFSIPAGQPLMFSVPPGGAQKIAVSFAATDSAPPHARAGTLVASIVQTKPLSIPLSATVDTVCTEAGQFIYTIEENGRLARFDPRTLTFTNIGFIHCPSTPGDSPFSMALDQDAIAWVNYSSGALFRVDVMTAACTATTYKPNQVAGFSNYGMGFVFDPTNNTDTLFVAGGTFGGVAMPSPLGVIAFPSLALTRVGTIDVGWVELTGTGDGQLWAFAPGPYSTSGVATLARVSPTNGATISRFTFPSITMNGAFALKFWGGSFWIFLGNQVFAVNRATGALTLEIPASGRTIVGAGVSSCAPIN